MSTSRLKIYNEALLILGERALASLTENLESRHLLDHVWDNDGVKACLEAGQWKFAMRAVRIDYDPAIAPDFGHNRAFLKPSDWVVTSAVCTDEFFNAPLLQYVDESGFWYASIDQIYVRYVSNDANYGGDLSRWTTRFADFVGAHFASKIVFKLTGDKERLQLANSIREKRLKEARSIDAMADPTKFPAEGSWNRARRSYGATRERGNRQNLIG